jgi:hypothetical protein
MRPAGSGAGSARSPKAPLPGVVTMTVIWLIVWLIKDTPDVVSWGPWNSWGIALFVCLAIDLLGALGNHGRRHRHRAW